MSRLYMMVTITDRNRKKKFEEFYKKNDYYKKGYSFIKKCE